MCTRVLILRFATQLSHAVVRTTARTTNLLVILFGAGFSAMLVYALTSELFSKNSATVLYGQACELIKSSDKVRPRCLGHAPALTLF